VTRTLLALVSAGAILEREFIFQPTIPTKGRTSLCRK